MRKSDIKFFPVLCSLALMTQLSLGQTSQKKTDLSQTVQETSRVLKKAKDGDTTEAREALEKVAKSDKLDDVKKTAASQLAKRNASEETSSVKKKSDSAAPAPDLTSAKPQPLEGATIKAPKKEKQGDRAVITSRGAAFFDSKQAIGVFTEDVIVDHPQFHLTGDELEVYMIKEEDKQKTAVAGNQADAAIMTRKTPLPGEDAEPEPDSSIRQAIAKGRKVVIEKRSETGEIQIGICRHATYIGANGDIVMRDYPQIQRGHNLIVATDPSTVMTIKQNGKIKTDGPNRVEIIQDNDDKKHPATPAPQAAPPLPGTMPVPVLSKPNSQNE